jgi:hypothetical protein
MYLPVNLATVQAATGFDYPPGLYVFKITGVDTKPNQDGQGQRLVVANEIVMGPGPSTQFIGRPLANSYQLSDKGAPFLKRLFLCCGIDEAFIQQQGGNCDDQWLLGRQYVASVVKNGNYTNITNERPLSEWNVAPQGGKSAQASGAPAPQPALLQPTAPQAMMPPAQGAMGQQYAQQPGLPPTSLPPAMPAPQMPTGFQAPAPPPGQVGR